MLVPEPADQLARHDLGGRQRPRARRIPLSQFYVAKPGDSAATINPRSRTGLNLLFTPGIYHVSQTINVTRANTVVLGLGYATIIPDGGVDPDDGRRRRRRQDRRPALRRRHDQLAGRCCRSGRTARPASHAANPTSIQDVFFRIGGAGAGKATNSLVVNSSNTIIDHIWAWRADHGTGVGWTTNTADTGLTVNGDNVTAYGLFVEHYQKYDVVWNGKAARRSSSRTSCRTTRRTRPPT